jgi:glyoxylase-like metal-dependent hydrolase (beta-lactamase superfamily II)
VKIGKIIMNNLATQKRFYSSGPLLTNFHLLDLFLYDSSLFANCVIVEDTDFTTIIDTGTSNTIEPIINYLHFNDIKIKNVLLIPTHHHFDHIGGINPLIDFLEKNDSNVNVISSKLMTPWLIEPSGYVQAAARGFNNKTVGEITGIKEQYITEVEGNELIVLGEEWTLKMLQTPGHCDDHMSPLLVNSNHDHSICYFGEALGINLQKDMYPIPASSAPDFNGTKYVESIEKLVNYYPKINAGIFSHFGGISGVKSIQQTGLNAITQYNRFRNAVIRLYEKNPSTRYITEQIFKKYSDSLATRTINTNGILSRNLTFTNVYGILLDENLKEMK